MILLYGIPSEPPLRLVTEAVRRMGVPHVFLNQRRSVSGSLRLDVSEPALSGRLEMDGQTVDLVEVTGVYARPMDDTLLPELRREPANSRLRIEVRALHQLLFAWTEVAPGMVINRPSAMVSNGCKPYQARLISEAGIEVPTTLVTNDPREVLDFRHRFGRIIFKSISGARSIVREFREEDRSRLHHLKTCPVQFQEWIDGDDVRVHVVGDQVFAVLAQSEATDYRYAGRFGADLRMSPLELPPSFASRCIELSQRLGLTFSGIDFKRTPDGRFVCFEVNPCPAFSFYEEHTGQPIAAAVAELLAQPLKLPCTPAITR
ncbi:MAG TPA: ATP-grasp domain-containing protein [Planctomycetota bacterium]|jgi:hypothetical protein|nr:ATP-grasp domain-containing protein [Planctomycetota bacterium]